MGMIDRSKIWEKLEDPWWEVEDQFRTTLAAPGWKETWEGEQEEQYTYI